MSEPLAIQERCLKCLRALAVPTRFKIFSYLVTHGDVPVSRLVKLTGLKQPTVSFHLKCLQTVGLVKKSRAGRNVLCYSIRRHPRCPLFV